MQGSILSHIINSKKQGLKQLAVLLDPDKTPLQQIPKLVALINKANVNFIFIGGSLLQVNHFEEFVKTVKKISKIPVLLFPGNALQISDYADGILFLSLISGRNPEFLIGNHVIAAPILKNTNLEIIPTSYLLIENGSMTSVEYMSNTKPIPKNKTDLAIATALAGEMLGHQLIYLEAGSGAKSSVPIEMIKNISLNCKSPIIVGGGIKSKVQLNEVFNNGADIAVIGSSFENNPFIINDII